MARIIKAGERITRMLAVEDLEVKSIDEKTRTIWHPITREVTDRRGDIVRIDGMDLTQFKKKPAVLYGHKYGGVFDGTTVPIIGTNVGFEKDGDKLYAGTRFLDVSTPDMSQGLKDLVNDNWILQGLKLMGWSVGFMAPADGTTVIRDGDEMTGYDFTKSTLLEYSSVVIPAHQDAVNDAIRKGLVPDVARKIFDMAVPAIGTAAPVDVVEKPYPNDHSCVLTDKSKYDKFGYQDREHEGKKYRVLRGKIKGEDTWEDHSFRYAKDVWTAAEARTHCKDHKGSFEAASGEASICEGCSAADIEPDKRGTAPDAIDKAEPAAEPAPQIDTQQITGGNMLEKILEKQAKGEALTPEEEAFLAKARLALAPAKAAEPPPAPVRKLELVDVAGVKTRSITDIMNEPHGARTMSGPLNDCEKELQEFSENAYITATLLGKNPRHLKMWENFTGRSSALRKALDAATATEGAEWVPTLLSADFITKFRLQAKVAALFPDFAMPSNPWKMPYFGGLSASNFYYVGESISDEAAASPPSTPATGDQTLTAKKLKSRILFSDELVEDSIVPVIEVLRADLATAGTEVLEDIVLNGDVTAVHQDSDVTDSKDRRRAWSGLRKLCPTATKGSLATFTAASHIAAFIVLMGKYGINPSELAFITGGVGYNKFRALTETLTVDKYGPSAVILNGELGKLFGSPIIISEYIRENLNATGVYDATTMTKTQVLIVNRRGFMLGTRGGVKLTFKAEAEVDQNQLIMSFRKAFQPRWTPSASVLTIANGYNVA